jgi:hypothetical protein
MARSRKKTAKIIENDRQRAKTASPIRKRLTGPRRAMSHSQPHAQALDQLAEAASITEPASMHPPSRQSSMSAESGESEIKEELPTTPTIIRRAAAKSRKPRLLSISSTDSEPTEYYIEWLVYIGKQLLHSDLVSSEKWDLTERWRGQKQRVKVTLEQRGKGEYIIPRIASIPISISTKGIKVLLFSTYKINYEG